MAINEAKMKREERAHNARATHVWLFLLPENDAMNLEKLKAMPTQDLIDLYNDLTNKQVKRMATRADAERRTIEELKKAGKWVDEVVPPGQGDKAQKNITETANAGINDGTPHRTGVRKKAAKAAKKPQEKAKKAVPVAKAAKGTSKPAAKAPAATPAKRKGAPTKNQTYIAIAPSEKTFNPKGLKIQGTSSRMQVLEYIRSKEGKRTRDQILAHFDKKDVNVDSALYFLTKYGFCRVSE